MCASDGFLWMKYRASIHHAPLTDFDGAILLLDSPKVHESLDLLHKSKIKNPTPHLLTQTLPSPKHRGGVGGGVLRTFARSLFLKCSKQKALPLVVSKRQSLSNCISWLELRNEVDKLFKFC